MAENITVLLAGSTGLVGKACLRRLLADPSFSQVIAPVRRALPPELSVQSTRLDERMVDFERLDSDEYADLFDVDAVICCLGTTIKKAGSRERFREVDYGYPKMLAERGVDGGARHYMLVSALGADPDSRIFYNRVKGEIERAVLDLPYRSVTIVRPSLLLGDRDEFRLGEEIATRLRFLFPGKYKPVHADDVASVLVDAAREDAGGRSIIESREIRKRARRLHSAD